ncbi:unnamed protein product [Nesidiocoris tenuis]|uniref:Uncharacterized protein n=1 Tax=Nesidiocoris tenuis TaxID=355587 RepID=A0A6H5GJS6_9HEMI|nr:unnamed protein product [Nesidiocoris tenuis]
MERVLRQKSLKGLNGVDMLISPLLYVEELSRDHFPDLLFWNHQSNPILVGAGDSKVGPPLGTCSQSVQEPTSFGMRVLERKEGSGLWTKHNWRWHKPFLSREIKRKGETSENCPKLSGTVLTCPSCPTIIDIVQISPIMSRMIRICPHLSYIAQHFPKLSSPSELKLFGQLEAKHPKDAVFTLGRRLFPLTRWLNNTASTSGTAYQAILSLLSLEDPQDVQALRMSLASSLHDPFWEDVQADMSSFRANEPTDEPYRSALCHRLFSSSELTLSRRCRSFSTQMKIIAELYVYSQEDSALEGNFMVRLSSLASPPRTDVVSSTFRIWRTVGQQEFIWKFQPNLILLLQTARKME